MHFSFAGDATPAIRIAAHATVFYKGYHLLADGAWPLFHFGLLLLRCPDIYCYQGHWGNKKGNQYTSFKIEPIIISPYLEQKRELCIVKEKLGIALVPNARLK